ncbi:phosphoribosyl-ATP diphosphatase, partial [Elioraea sp.]|uniref:phosphoribosyl-ATP diphosphatase n=1 Tax=Elioraea sp. TaxID=2185103 RepID=UPI00307F3C9D
MAKTARTARPRRTPGATAPADGTILDRLWATVESRKGADPALSHSARLLARGTAKVAQKLGEEAVEAVIEATRGNRDGVIAESADLLYHHEVVEQ